MARKVLFLCIHNSARSQMAEAFLQKFGGDEFQAFSAGIEPGKLNPYVVKVLQEDEGIDISKNETKSAFDFVKQGVLFQHIVTVCDESSQRCPIFPGVRERIIMSFEDPSGFIGNDEEILEKTRKVKDKIKEEVLRFIELVKHEQLKTNFPKNWNLG
ncbi:MAG: arsenate reductase ArsC [Helicobacteraceae bacterium]|nr:arsenate reductase ArsC [Candidatus Sulfurimonas ponti]MBL6973671.1 arsenate reductase ArsC [Sulfurimonas sp.]